MTTRLCLQVIFLLTLTAGDIFEVPDQLYLEGQDVNPRKHRLNLHIPKGKVDFPTIVFIHGGAWREGDRSLFDALGRRFAEEGVAAAVISYRLAPETKHPGQVKDCAHALAWVLANISSYKGRADQVFLMGHSAGAHLASLLALDQQYLDEVKIPHDAIKGVILVGGVYSIQIPSAEKPRSRAIILDAFGDDAETCRKASPITYLGNAAQPFLVLTETVDTFQLRSSMQILKEGVDKAKLKNFTFVNAEDRDHQSIIGRMMALGADPYRARIVRFVKDIAAASADQK